MNQYYRVHAVIDLDAICHNIQEVKRVVGEGVKVMPVIKADGYGHGAVPRLGLMHLQLRSLKRESHFEIMGLKNQF